MADLWVVVRVAQLAAATVGLWVALMVDAKVGLLVVSTAERSAALLAGLERGRGMEHKSSPKGSNQKRM